MSQILALFRDRLLANSFGAGEELDIYYAAFRIPDFIYIAIASFVSITVLVPFLVEKLNGNENNSHGVSSFINSVLTAFFAIMVLSGAIAFFLYRNSLISLLRDLAMRPGSNLSTCPEYFFCRRFYSGYRVSWAVLLNPSRNFLFTLSGRFFITPALSRELFFKAGTWALRSCFGSYHWRRSSSGHSITGYY